MTAPMPASRRRRWWIIVVEPGTPSGQAGADLQFIGRVDQQRARTSVDLDNVYFNLFSGPASADLTSAIFFSDFQAPLTFAPNQTYTGPLFRWARTRGARRRLSRETSPSNTAAR